MASRALYRVVYYITDEAVGTYGRARYIRLSNKLGDLLPISVARESSADHRVRPTLRIVSLTETFLRNPGRQRQLSDLRSTRYSLQRDHTSLLPFLHVAV
jgi:hypothetical protein